MIHGNFHSGTMTARALLIVFTVRYSLSIVHTVHVHCILYMYIIHVYTCTLSLRIQFSFTFSTTIAETSAVRSKHCMHVQCTCMYRVSELSCWLVYNQTSLYTCTCTCTCVQLQCLYICTCTCTCTHENSLTLSLSNTN